MTLAVVLLHGLLTAAAPHSVELLVGWTSLASRESSPDQQQSPAALDRLATMLAAMAEAAIAVEGGYGSVLKAPVPRPPRRASAEAAAAAAAHAALRALRPRDSEGLAEALRRSLATIADVQARDAGAAVGRLAAGAVLRLRAKSGLDLPDRWKQVPPGPGIFLAEGMPIGTRVAEGRPWFLQSLAQVRPGPPPSLDAPLWSRDLAEVRAKGAKSSPSRSAAETEAALFWRDVGPSAWIGAIARMSAGPGRSMARNARLWALAATVADDTQIAFYDAKYTFRFWRPATAIQQADPAWQPLLRTPAHPEYPCAHCATSAALATVLASEFGTAPPGLSLASPEGARTFPSLDALVDEVVSARVNAGVHYRFSGLAGVALGRAVARQALAVAWPPLH